MGGIMITIDLDIELPVATIYKKVYPLQYLSKQYLEGTNTIIYIGSAEYGSSEDDAVWKVTELRYRENGTQYRRVVRENMVWSQF